MTPIDNNSFHANWTTNIALVDEFGTVSSQPIDLSLRYVFQDPDDGQTKVLYVRDTELRWTEIVAGVRSHVVPARYVSQMSIGVKWGPMTREWFLDMVSQFTVSDSGVLLREGLEVCQVWDDFEWKVYAVLPTIVGDDFRLEYFTPERLVQAVRTHCKVWHLDSLIRASSILYHFNSVSPLHSASPTSTGLDLVSRLRPCSFSPLPRLLLDNGDNYPPPSVDSGLTSSFISHSPSISPPPLDSVMNFEGEI